MGLLGYYRCYVRDFAKKVKPLYSLLSGDEERVLGSKTGAKSRKRVGQKYDARESIIWTDECQRVVDQLIDHFFSKRG